jgi:predicted NBD/HSP70 family sugar kinase
MSAMNLFVSYSHQDEITVADLVGRLRKFGHQVWVDEDLHSRGGQLWWDSIVEQIQTADVCVLALSPNWITSDVCVQELEYAVSLTRHILPVLVLPTDPESLPNALQQRQLIDFTTPDMDSLGNLVMSVERLGSAPPLPSPLPAAPVLPESDLFKIRRVLSNSEFLELDRQYKVVTTLAQCLERPRQRHEAAELLAQFKRRKEITKDFYTQVEVLLSELDQPLVTEPERQRQRDNSHPEPASTQSRSVVSLPSNSSSPFALQGKNGFYAGIDVGRHSRSWGVLEVEDGSVQQRSQQRNFHATLNNQIFAEIVQLIDSLDVDHLDGLGVGLPGEVEPIEGILVRGPSEFPNPVPFRSTLAVEIAKHEQVATKFGPPGKLATDERLRAIRSTLFVDNDVNCAARETLRQHVEVNGEPDWRSFACIYIGTVGVGCGLVLDGHVYHGTRGVAGELGHVPLTVNLKSGRDHGDIESLEKPHRCECGTGDGSPHWQELINLRAMETLGWQIDPDLYKRLLDEHDGDDRSAILAGIEYVTSHCDEAGQDNQGRTSRAHEGINENEVASICRLLRTHATYVAIGVAALMNVLDLDHVVLGGGVIKELFDNPVWTHQLFKEAELRAVPTVRHEIRSGKLRYDPVFGNADPAWIGAALLPLDRAFGTLREGSGSAATHGVPH